MQPTYEGKIQLGAAELFVRTFGNSSDDLIFVHGGPGWDHSYFLPFVLPLASNRKLTFFDLRDCGHSHSTRTSADQRRSYIDACVEDLKDLMTYMNLTSAHLLGFSLGGRIAMRFAEKYPEKIKKLVLASTTAFSGYRPLLEEKTEFKQRMTPERRQKVDNLWNLPGDEQGNATKAIAFEYIPLNIHNEAFFPVAEKALQKIAFTDLWGVGYSSDETASLSKRNYDGVLSNLNADICILHGENDLVFPVEIATRLHSALPSSQLHILASTGHLAHMEATEAWNSAVGNFLN